MTRWTPTGGLMVAMVALGALVTGCEDEVTCPTPTVDLNVCDPAAGGFTLDIDNEWLPMPVGYQAILEGDDDGVTVRVEITVLDATEVVAGVVTRVVEEAEYEDGEVVEISLNYFAQAADGTVCYFGEEVDIYDHNGQVVGHGGSWRADEGNNQPGIMMPADPQVGDAYYQEQAPGAMDMAEVVELGVSVTTPYGTLTDAMKMRDCNPIDKDADTKYYARDIGLVVDDVAKLISVTVP